MAYSASSCGGTIRQFLFLDLFGAHSVSPASTQPEILAKTPGDSVRFSSLLRAIPPNPGAL